MAESQSGPDLDEPPSSLGERHSRERVARPAFAERVRRRALRMARGAIGSPRTRYGGLRRAIAPLVLALVPLFWVVDATWRSTLTPIGRDQGIFHYIAWAVKGGAVDYRDVRDVNGPLVHLLHMIALAFGGDDEHRFHVLDVWATGISFAIVGALLPGIIKRARAVDRIAWAFAGWVILSAQYALYLYWNQAQRESFCDWFLLPSIALQIGGLRNARRIVLLAALSTITWFGKSSFVLFTAMQFGVLMIDDATPFTRRDRLKYFAAGGVLGALPPLLYLLRYGDLLAYLQITFRDVPQIYRYIWARSAREVLGDEGPLGQAAMAFGVSALLTALVALRALPRRMLALALAPVVGILTFVAQAKGFGYHLHPTTATTSIGLLVIAVMLWETYRAAPRSRALGRFVALGAIGFLALYTASSMHLSPLIKNVWILGGGETAKLRSEQEYFDTFKSHDFFPWEIRQGARYLSDVLPTDARVQVYGMDPYILFLAQRRSATPYIYAYDLNADAALDGGWSNRPTWLETERIKAWRASHENDLLARLKEAPPEAFVFIDKAPLITWPDAWEDFKHCCSETALWVANHYHAARTFEEVHVWIRDDMPIPDAQDLP